jgi:drug/metabolite transporter (DMT)-like permease
MSVRPEFLLIGVVALCWGGYPLLARASGYGGPYGALVLNLAALAPIALALALWPGASERPALEAVAKLAVAGALMGCGIVAFNALVNSPLEASVSIPIVDTAMLVVTVACAVVFFQEPLTARKLLGLLLLVAGIAVLRPD